MRPDAAADDDAPGLATDSLAGPSMTGSPDIMSSARLPALACGDHLQPNGEEAGSKEIQSSARRDPTRHPDGKELKENKKYPMTQEERDAVRFEAVKGEFNWTNDERAIT